MVDAEGSDHNLFFPCAVTGSGRDDPECFVDEARRIYAAPGALFESSSRF
jgi:hypothetical protein